MPEVQTDTEVCFTCLFPLTHVQAGIAVDSDGTPRLICCRCMAVAAGQTDAEDTIRTMSQGIQRLHDLSGEFLEDWLTRPTLVRNQYPLRIFYS